MFNDNRADDNVVFFSLYRQYNVMTTYGMKGNFIALRLRPWVLRVIATGELKLIVTWKVNGVKTSVRAMTIKSTGILLHCMLILDKKTPKQQTLLLINTVYKWCSCKRLIEYINKTVLIVFGCFVLAWYWLVLWYKTRNSFGKCS